MTAVAAQKISVAEYHEMIERGELDENDRVELLEGELVAKMTIHPPHSYSTHVAWKLLDSLSPGYVARSQDPVTLSTSEPEPDVSFAKGHLKDFKSRHPGPTDLRLVVEVADSLLDTDREVKGRIYARERIAEYWIINLVDEHVEVYTQPSGPDASPAYPTRTDYPRGSAVPFALDGVPVSAIAVNDLLP